MTNKIANERASFSYNCVLDMKKKNKENKIQKEYKSYCRKFPSLIQTNGLAAAVAFANDKRRSSKAWGYLHDNIESWFLKCGFLESNCSLEEHIVNLNSVAYRIETEETQQFMVWLSRFASGLIEGE